MADQTPAAQTEASIRAFIGRLFDDPSRLAEVISHRLTRPFEVRPHAHRQQAQFDLILDAQGTAVVGSQRLTLSRCTALAVYPGEEHGYRLEPGRDGPAEVYHVKLNVWPAWEAIERRVWPAAATGMTRQAGLASAMRAVVRLGLVQATPSMLLLARLAEALALLPRRGTGAGVWVGGDWGKGNSGACGDGEQGGVWGGASAGGFDLSADAVMAQAMLADADGDERAELPRVLAMVERRLSHPPSLEEMAALAHLSPRHFTRRFKAVLGCTPHAYVTARRVARARQLLLERDEPLRRIGEELGFTTLAGFSRWFTQNSGQTPSAYRDNDRLL